MKNFLLAVLLFLALAVKGQGAGSIVIYGSNTCDHCITLQRTLDSAKVNYVFHDIDVDQAKEMEMVAKLHKFQFRGDISIPVVDVMNQKLLVGATYQTISAAIKELEE